MLTPETFVTAIVEQHPRGTRTNAAEKTFNSFVKGMISDYLNSDKLPKLQESNLVRNVEIPPKAE